MREYCRIVMSDDAMERINNLAAEGWRLVEVIYDEFGREVWVMERDGCAGPSEHKEQAT